jgi:hypothetical protein
MIGIQVEGGWSIDSNVFINEDFNFQEIPFDSSLLFSAVNHITGKSISISYENRNIGYSLNCCILSRFLGVWRYDENTNIYITLKTDYCLRNIYDMLPQYLNPLKKNFIPLKISSWKIIYNNLIEEDYLYNDVELVFSATRGKLFIDIVYYKNMNKSYYIYMGLSKYEYSELTYNINKPTLEYKEIYLEKIEDVIDLTNGFLIANKWGNG